MNKQEKAERSTSSLAYLKTQVKAGDTIYTTLTRVSRSGMMRHIGVYIVCLDDNGKPFIRRITGYVADVLGYSVAKNDDLKVSGAGMDMGYHVAYSLGSVLFGRGAETQKLGYMTHRNGSTEPETDGGYCINHQWL